MKCEKCGKEGKLEESHDVPTYLFRGNRKERKQKADKMGRHLLCKQCHNEYEFRVMRHWIWYDLLKELNNEQLNKGIRRAKSVASRFFKGDLT